ncbi:hypothetical protein [Arthrobacter woluwensis]|uniref:hypothetical protein n=1 Tax=Arthrobacter woluwensis TaxID=156980 RepID=UPI0027D7E05B|nr:hypothetical protein [Arthrobacter woluwensis]
MTAPRRFNWLAYVVSMGLYAASWGPLGFVNGFLLACAGLVVVLWQRSVRRHTPDLAGVPSLTTPRRR